MGNLWIVLLAVALLAILLFAKQKQGKAAAIDDGKPWPYQPRHILTDREQVLYHRLREALPDCLILCQVQLSQIIMVKHRAENRHTWLNKIIQKSADFVVCQADTSVLAVIELDDKSHNNPKQAARDADKSRALKDAGVRLIRAKEIPSVASLCRAFGRKPPVQPQDREGVPGIEVREIRADAIGKA